MNREQAKQLLPIIQAFADGADVQVSNLGEWLDTQDPDFGVPPWGQWRIKPKPVECWVGLNRKGQPFCVGETDKETRAYAQTYNGVSPFRIVHMVEVTE